MNIQSVIEKKLQDLYSDVIGQTRIASFCSINQFAYIDITIISITTVAHINIYIYILSLSIYSSTLAVTYYFIIFEMQQILHLTCRMYRNKTHIVVEFYRITHRVKIIYAGCICLSWYRLRPMCIHTHTHQASAHVRWFKSHGAN